MKKKVLLSSIMTIALCLCLIVGSTFALFTSQSDFNIAVTAGKVEVQAGLTAPVLKSAQPLNLAQGAQIPSDAKVDENGAYYQLVEQQGRFANGGTAVIEEGTLKLDKITPGDRVEFDVTVANESDVAILERLIVECTKGYGLMSGLEVTIGSQTYTSLEKYVSDWTSVDATEDVDNVSVAIELPINAGNEYQKLSTEINFKVEAVQGNANVNGQVSSVTLIDRIIDADGFAAALAEGGEIVLGADVAITDTVSISNDTVIYLHGNNIDASANTSRPLWLYDADLTIVASAETVKVGLYGMVDIKEGDCDVTLIGGNYVGETENGALVKPRGEGDINITLNDVNYTDTSVRNFVVNVYDDYTGEGVNININGGKFVVANAVTGWRANVNINGATINATHTGLEMGRFSTALVDNSTIIVDADAIDNTAPQSCIAASNLYRNGNGGQVVVNNCILKSNVNVFAIFSDDDSSIVANGCSVENTGSYDTVKVYDGQGTITVN